MDNQVVFHPQRGFGDDFEGMVGEQIEVLMNASGKRVLNRNDGTLSLPARHSIKRILKRQTVVGLDSASRISSGQRAG